jgi:membrane-bound lytic murein transglycosylase D
MKPNKQSIVYFFSGILLCAFLMIGFSLKKPDPVTTPVEYGPDGRPQYRWYPPSLPTTFDFAGEAVPLDRWDVREKMDREVISNAYQHGNELYMLKLAGRYFPVIEERLRANGIPDDFKYVCVAESSLNQNAMSGVGAASFWQFMKETGPHYGLEINDEVDERFNVVKATDGACKYFKEAKEKFGSWTAAAASYNCGQGGYNNQCGFQGGQNYYDLIFTDETNRYVYRILALKYIMSHAKMFGFMIEQDDQYKPLRKKTVTVDKSIENLADFAKENGTNYKMLKIYNPWLRGHRLTVRNGKRYEVAIPLNP